MKIKIFCDRCDKELEPPVAELTRIEEDPGYFFPEHYWLCKKCSYDFRKWLKT